MASYGSRRGPNVSQYIANLNTVDDSSPIENLLGGDDLSLFATTDFFDFDMGNEGLGGLPPASEFDHRAAARKSTAADWQESKSDFMNSDFTFPDVSSFPSITTTGPTTFTTPTYNNNNTLNHITSPTSATSPTAPRAGEKRKLNSISEGGSIHGGGGIGEDGARVVAEEDKRRRNTAASARFRIKKKQREQALEKTAKEMTEKASRLETKVGQLEMENKWLKSLITEKNEVGKGDFQELYEEFTAERRAEDERSRENRNDGVGTAAAAAVESDAEGEDYE